MNISDAIDIMESVAGVTDESTPAGEAWAAILRHIRTTSVAQPVPPEPGEVQELVEWLRQEAAEYHPGDGDSLPSDVRDTLLDASARCTRAAELLERLSPPQPGEVQELVSSLRSQRANYLEKLQRLERYEKALSAVMPPDFKDWWENSKDEWPDVAAGVIENLRKREELAWKQVERLSRPHPVPVSERLPGPEDCDAKGMCWAWRVEGPESNDFGDCWHLISAEWLIKYCQWTHWLPAHTLPLPVGTSS